MRRSSQAQIKTQTATISDVAKSAQVSMKTVSRVLNREPNVKPATRELVEQAMRDLGYRPNSPARMLASNKTFLIGLIYNASSSYIASIQNGVLKAARPEHYEVLILPCAYDSPNLLAELRDFISSKRVDGLVLLPPVSDVPGVQELLDEQEVANISISRKADSINEPSVITNDREVCRDMVKHLTSLGHRRIAYVRNHPGHKAMSDRYLGYLDGIADADIELNQAFVTRGDNSFESGVECGQQLLSRSPRPTAIFCANDQMAAGVMRAAHEAGLKIPEEISIAGFDDMPLASKIWPQLTTIKPPLEEMAKQATLSVIQMVRDESLNSEAMVIDAEIVLRHSTAKAPD